MKSRGIAFALVVACALLLGALLAWPAEAVADAYEPDDWPEDATPLVLGVVQEHTMDPAWDVDYVVLQAVRGVAYRFEASVGPESLLDLYAEMEDPLGFTYVIDSGWSGESETYAFVAEASGPYVFGIEARSADTGPYTVKVSPIPRDPYEPDDWPEEAAGIAVDGTIQQRDLVPSGDVDFVKFPVVEGRIYVIEASPNDGSESDIEITLGIFWAGGEFEYAFVNNWGPGLPERLRYDADATETLYLRIRDPREQDAPEGDYRLRVAEHVKLTVSPESIDFGAVALGSSAVKTVRITNPGPRAESMDLGLAGWNTAEYELLDSYASVPAGGYRDVRIRYAPTTSFTGATRFVDVGGVWWEVIWYGPGPHPKDGDAFHFQLMTYGQNVGRTGPFDWASRVEGHEITGRDTAAAGDIYGVFTAFDGAYWNNSSFTFSCTAKLTPGYEYSKTWEDGLYTGNHVAFVLRSSDCQLRAVQPDIEATAKVDVYGTVPESTPLDTTPPVTTAGGYDAAWHKSAVTVTLSALDNPGGSGVAKTEYKLDAGAWATGTSVTVPVPADHSRDGLHTVSYRSVDKAGNVETAKTCTVRIDTRKPVTKAPSRASVRRGRRATLKYKVLDLAPNGGKANVRIRIKTLGGRTVKTLRFTNKPVNVTLAAKFRCKLAKKTYRFYVYARDAAGNAQSKVGRNRLIVK